MSDCASAICDRALPHQTPASGAPEWVHLFPNGKMVGRDGRDFNLADPQAVVQAFEVGGIDLPIDMNTSTTNVTRRPVARFQQRAGSRN